jgi:SAM-dependent methyltransferase
MTHHLRQDCRLCGLDRLQKVLSLTPTPPANAFRGADELAQPQTCYPLDLYLCQDCTHVQLADVIHHETLFNDYVYVSGTSPAYVEHLRDYAADVHARYGGAHQRVLEFGSNDGTFLQFFQEFGYTVLGIDPARAIAEGADAAGIPTRCDFFGSACATALLAEGYQPDIILANHVYAHIDDLRGVTASVSALLPPGGFFIFEVSYLQDVIEHMLFDTIYHEHVAYHSVRALLGFLRGYGMEIIEVQRTAHQGGSLRVFAQRHGVGVTLRPVDPSVPQFLAQEARWNLDKPATYHAYAERIAGLKQRLLTELRRRKQAGETLAAFGAPAKATTLMYHFGIDASLIDCIIDSNVLKQGLYSPGLNIPVLPPTALAERAPDAVVVLAWNFADSIMQRERDYVQQGGTFIVPLPEFRIVQDIPAVA